MYYQDNLLTHRKIFASMNIFRDKTGDISYEHSEWSGKALEKHILLFTWRRQGDIYDLTQTSSPENSERVTSPSLGVIVLADHGKTAIIDIPAIGHQITMHRYFHDWSH